MNVKCYPISLLPHLSKLFLDFAARRKAGEALDPFYPTGAYSGQWMDTEKSLSAGRRATLCELLGTQNLTLEAPAAGSPVPDFSQIKKNLEALAEGAGAVVTGQQTTLLGGPLYTLFKAATAVRRARDATAAGHPHVPIFWLASEDHDLAEANQVSLLGEDQVETLHIDWNESIGSSAGNGPNGSSNQSGRPNSSGAPVGELKLGPGIESVLAKAHEMLSDSDPGAIWKDIRACYLPEATFSSAFAGLIRRVFAPYGLIVIDASSRAFHALGAKTLRAAIVQADELHGLLENRGRELMAAGYHTQVLVAAESSLLFLIDQESGARVALHRSPGGDGKNWLAGRQSYSTEDLLAILDAEPERLSPNALLRPVFQDTILPTSTYIGGPAEVAYFAQSNVLYESILNHVTPIQPRFSATLLEPEIAGLLDHHCLSLPEALQAAAGDPLELSQQLGANRVPENARQKFDSTEKALEDALAALTGYFDETNPDLARAATVRASKMRYQMKRLRMLAANDQLQRNRDLAEDAKTLQLNLFPLRHPQERVFGFASFLARHGKVLVEEMVEAAAEDCIGHRAVRL